MMVHRTLQSVRWKVTISWKDLPTPPFFLCVRSALWVLTQWGEASSRESPPVADSSLTLKRYVCSFPLLLPSSALCFSGKFSPDQIIVEILLRLFFFLIIIISENWMLLNQWSGCRQTEVELNLFFCKFNDWTAELCWWICLVVRCWYNNWLTACGENGEIKHASFRNMCQE